jgi:hypothetical protein
MPFLCRCLKRFLRLRKIGCLVSVHEPGFRESQRIKRARHNEAAWQIAHGAYSAPSEDRSQSGSVGRSDRRLRVTGWSRVWHNPIVILPQCQFIRSHLHRRASISPASRTAKGDFMLRVIVICAAASILTVGCANGWPRVHHLHTVADAACLPTASKIPRSDCATSQPNTSTSGGDLDRDNPQGQNLVVIPAKHNPSSGPR